MIPAQVGENLPEELIVVFAAVIMVVVLVGTILNNQGGGTKGTPVLPWDWGKDQPKDQPAQP